MAKKRMFSTDIIHNDVFLDMPVSSQLLYIHLCMMADDYGFVSPKRVMRMIGATDDDLKILIAKRYVLTFPSGVVVIKHWLVNNTIRKDRSHATTFQDEFKSLTYNEFGAYTEVSNVAKVAAEIASVVTKLEAPVEEVTTKSREKTEVGNQMATNGKPNGNQMATENRIEENSIVSKDTKLYGAKAPSVAKKTPSVDITEMFIAWESIVGYKIEGQIKNNRYACSNLLKKHGKDKLLKILEGVALAKQDRYAPQIADFTQLQYKFNDLISWGNKRKMTSGLGIIV